MIQSLVNVEETFPDIVMETDLGTFTIKASDYSSATNPPLKEVILGKAEHGVWKKNFKLRVTSKHTGRKFDINLTCKTQYSNQEE